MSSYRQINYALRPAKAVERKMLCDMFRHYILSEGLRSIDTSVLVQSTSVTTTCSIVLWEL